jgi:multidrug efflux pump subunit AcrA (membrane-fusion protein)
MNGGCAALIPPTAAFVPPLPRVFEKLRRAKLEKDKANIENAELNLRFTKITAPFDGRIENTEKYPRHGSSSSATFSRPG